MNFTIVLAVQPVFRVNFFMAERTIAPVLLVSVLTFLRLAMAAKERLVSQVGNMLISDGSSDMICSVAPKTKSPRVHYSSH